MQALTCQVRLPTMTFQACAKHADEFHYMGGAYCMNGEDRFGTRKPHWLLNSPSHWMFAQDGSSLRCVCSFIPSLVVVSIPRPFAYRELALGATDKFDCI